MTELEQIRNKVASIEIIEEVDSILEINKEEIVALLWEQLAKGESEQGETTLYGKPFYHPETISRKLQKSGLSSVIDRVTLFDTGDFYLSIYLEIREDEFIFKSDIYYEQSIVNKTGESIYRFNEKSLSILRDDIILPALQQKINLQLNGI